MIPVRPKFVMIVAELQTLVDRARQWKPVEHSRRALPTAYLLRTKWHRFQPGFCCASDTVPTRVAEGNSEKGVVWFYDDGGKCADSKVIVQ